MAFYVEIRVMESWKYHGHQEFVWKKMHQQGTAKPYSWASESEAETVMRLCYPNLVVDEQVRVVHD